MPLVLCSWLFAAKSDSNPLTRKCASIIEPNPDAGKSRMSESIAETLLKATRTLSAAGITEARLDAGLLLANFLGKDRTFLITHSADLVDDEQNAAFQERVRRRAEGEPLQHITSVQEFYGLTFEVSSAALIPRPETELLVECALEAIDKLGETPFVLEVGTGTGCIPIALLHERPSIHAVAVDLSPAAIQLAQRNAIRNSVRERIPFLVGDALSAFRDRPFFDVVVSNPPYIPDADWETLQREVRDHEPRLALTSGNDGLDMIRRLLTETAPHIREDGYFIFEIGYGQLAAVEQMINNQVWQTITVRSDLQRIPRTLVLRKRP